MAFAVPHPIHLRVPPGRPSPLLSSALPSLYPTGCSQHSNHSGHTSSTQTPPQVPKGLSQRRAIVLLSTGLCDPSPHHLYFLTLPSSSLRLGPKSSLLIHDYPGTSSRLSCLNGTLTPPYSLSNSFSVSTVLPYDLVIHISALLTAASGWTHGA